MRRVSAIATALAVLLGAGSARAYCRSAACPPHDPDGTTAGQQCDPSQDTDCGIVLQWRQPCISFSVQEDASRQVDYATAETVLTEAFATWTGLDCGGGPPSIQVLDFSPVSCDRLEYNQQGGNANVLMFRDASWPHDTDGGGTDTLALTTVTYDVDKGDIYDADIEVNTADNNFTVSDTPGPSDVDLLSVLTHETGHFFGLAHTTVMGATMFASYTPGTIAIRQPSPDDVAGLCDAYPVGRSAAGACTGIPRHGFAPECFAAQTYVRCAAGAQPGDGGDGGDGVVPLGASLALAVAAVAIRARRGSRGS
jgi:Matrixin